MSRSSPPIFKHLPKAIAFLFVALLFACGSSATATPVSSGDSNQPTARPQPTSVPATTIPSAGGSVAPTAIPTAAVQATKAPPPKVKPTGVINYGVPETGIFQGHPRELSSPRVQYAAVSYGESMWAIDKQLKASPLLVTEWSISDDFLTWTISIRDDVQFHKGYGLMTMDDITWNYKEYHEGALNARATILGDFWMGNQGGSQEIVDDFTIKVNTGVPWVPEVAYEAMRHSGGTSTSITSKKQSDELGVSEASVDIAATGPWEIVDHASGEFWKFKAVQDHWRQTPYFDEFIIWTIPEESARVAGFQTGNLDIFTMSFDSLPTVDAVDGSALVSVPNAGQAGLNIYGQTYGVDKEGNPYTATDCTNAWVSCNEDTSSQEWANAVMVKKAMSLAIDRQ
nr:hypothetical protein [Chloroflexota bacterium]